MKRYPIFILTCCLAACSVLKPAPSNTPNTYVLNAKPHHIPHAQQVSKTLLVTQTKTTSAYGTKRMVYRKTPHEIAYFAKNRWAESPDEMVAPLILETLSATGKFRAVTMGTSMTPADLKLETTLVALYQDFTESPSKIHMVLYAQLYDTRTHRVLMAERFEKDKLAPEDTPQGGVTAANKALQSILKNLARRVVAVS